MALSDLWQDIATQWGYITDHASVLETEIFDQEAWVMNSLTDYRNALFNSVSSSISELELKTYNAVYMVELTLNNLIDSVDSRIESRLRTIADMFVPHLNNITNKLEEAILSINTSGTMDYEYVDTEIYWAVYDVNLELDSLQAQIDGVTGISETKIKEMIDTSTSMLWTDTLLTINIVKNNLVDKINQVSDLLYIKEAQLQIDIDLQMAAARAYVVEQVAGIVLLIDALDSDITDYIQIKHRAAKKYTRNQIALAMADIDIAINEVNEVLRAEMVTLETDLNAKREKVVEDLVVYIVNTELRIHDQITVVSATVSTLANTTTWRAGFFDIFRSNPELSFLQVLLRDKEKFAEFKPYWQALFTRVMAED